MGVMAAFVFAAQMINFTLPAMGGEKVTADLASSRAVGHAVTQQSARIPSIPKTIRTYPKT